MFDFANSSYTTVIITVVYAVIFPAIIVGDAPDYRIGNLLWSIALSLSYLAVACVVPMLGAIMDYRAAKKKFLIASCILTIVPTAMLGLVKPGDMVAAMALIAISNFGFSAGEAFASSFLPTLGSVPQLGRISGMAWGVGYLGGLVSVALVSLLGPVEAHNYDNLRWTGPLTAAFFLVTATPTLLWLREPGVPRPALRGTALIAVGFRTLRATLCEIRQYRDLAMVLAALFFATAGLAIVIAFTFIYGNQVIRWDRNVYVLMFIVTQITAAAGAVVFGIAQDKMGVMRIFNATLVLWIVAIMGITYSQSITVTLQTICALAIERQHVFLAIGSIAGLCLGATQSAGRTIVAVLTPAGKAAEIFGFWSVCCKLASIAGILGVGLLQAAMGLERSILYAAMFFVVALVLTAFVNIERGRKVATDQT